MSIKLTNNLISLGASRLLTDRALEVQSVFERLSSGLRINSASDDPAGLKLSSELNVSSRVFTEALRSVNDAQSLVSLMEDALKEVTNVAERQKELAAQAAVDTLTAEQRYVLHLEANALANEMNRIIESVEFNGQKVFDDDGRTLQVSGGGAGDNFVVFELGQELLQTVGDGTFQTSASFDVGLNPNSIVLGDFNNDGIDDVATANYTDDSISVLLGNGDGTFQAEIVNFSGDGPNSLRAGDFNNDGILDLAHNNFGDSGLGDTVSILLGAGDGTFTEVATIQTGLGPTSLAIGDVDGDGNIDVTAATASLNFVSGLPEVTRIDTQDNGRYEVTDVTLVDAPVQEVTEITAIAGDTSISEVSTVTADGVGEREITDVTMAAGDNSIAEVTDITASDVGTREVTDFTLIEADNSVAEITDVTASNVGDREITDFTMIAADNSIAEITDFTMSAIGVQEVTDLTMESGANITSGDYFSINSADTAYYVWYNVDGAGGDPTPGGTGIEVAINSTDSDAQVATKTAAALEGTSGFSASASTNTVTVTNDELGSVADAADGTIGGAFAVSVTTQGTDSDIQENSYFTLETTGGSFYVWFDINNTGTDPTPGGTGIEVDVNYGDTANTVAAAVQAAIDANGNFNASVLTDTVTVTNAAGGAVADATAGDIAGGTFSVSTTTQGVDSDLQSGDYFLLETRDTQYYVWFNVDGAGSDPAVGGRTGIEVALTASDTASQVATKAAAAIDLISDLSASSLTDTLTVSNDTIGAVTNATDGTVGGAFAVNVTTNGSDSDIVENSYFTLDTPGTNYYFWFDIDNTGTSDPGVGGRTGVEIDVSAGDSATTVAAAIQAAVDGLGDFSASVLSDVVTVTNATAGVSGDGSKGDITGSTFAVSTTTQGADSDLQSGDHFLFETIDTQYYVWYNVDGAGGDPTVGGRTGIEVALTATDTADQVASKTAAAIDLISGVSASASTDTVTVTNGLIGAVTDASDGTVGGAFAAAVTSQGTDSDIIENSYFTLDTPGTDYYIWFDIDNTGTSDPGVAGRTGIEVDVNEGDSATVVAGKIQAAIDAQGDFSASVLSDVVTVTNATGGVAADATKGDITGSTFAVSTTTQGVDTDLQTGDYFLAHSAGAQYYIWYNVDGGGGDPTPGGTGIEVAVNGTDTAAQIATKTAAAMDANAAFGATALGDVVTISNATVGTETDVSDGTVGGAFGAVVTTQGTDTDITEGNYFTIDADGTNYYVWFDIDNTSTDPTVGGRTGIEVDVSAGDDANTVAAAIQAAVDGNADFSASVLGDEVTITNAATGPVGNITVGDIAGGTFAVVTDTEGAVSDILTGDYFYLSSPGTDYYVWYNVDGGGGDPAVGGRTGIEVAINSADDANTVATKLRNAINAEAEFGASVLGDTVTVTNAAGGVATDGSDQTVGGAFAVATTTQGTNSIIENGDYFTIDTVDEDYYFWFNFGGATDPSLGGRTGVEITANYGDTAATLAGLLNTAVNAQAELSGSVVGDTVTITDANLAVGDSNAGTITGLSMTTVVDGYAPVVLSGQYFELDSSTDSYYVWYNVDGGGGDPAVGGRTGIQVNISDGDTADSIATATAAAINARPELTASASTNQITVTDLTNGPIFDAANINVGGTFAVITTQQGEAPRVDPVLDEIFAPNHNLATGAAVVLSTNGTLPAPLTAGPTYYVIAVDDDTLAFATSLANAMTDTRIDITTFGVGTHSITPLAATDSGGIALGDGSGGFGSSVPFQAGTQPQDFELVDVNLDGKLDLLVAEGIDGTIGVQLGTGSGFGATTSYAVGLDPADIETGDFNGDGFVDIATAVEGADQVTILMGDGTGNFTNTQSVTVSGTAPGKLTIGDLNGDGRVDIITSDYDSGAGTGGTVLMNDGNGTFTNVGTYVGGGSVIDAAISDFDGDGAADILTVNEADSTVSLLTANTTTSVAMPAIDLRSIESAQDAIATVAGTIDRLTNELAAIGAAASRLQFMGSHILSQRDQYDVARSRITDVDVAKEVADLLRLQILQQVTTSLQAQASLSPQTALSLIQDAELKS